MTCFTIIMPAFNEEPYIGQAVRSVLSQSEADLELIVVDDGSTDNTAGIVEQEIYRDKRLRLLRPGKVGKVAAFNLAVSQANGDWFYFMGADDVMMPNALATWRELVHGQDPSRKIAARARLEMFSEQSKYNGLRLPKGSNVRNFSGPLTLQSRGLMQSVAPIPEMLPNEDTWWSLCIDHFAEHVLFSHDPVVLYRVHGGNSIARNANFADFSDKYHSRRRALELFLDCHRERLSELEVSRLLASIRLENARRRGKFREIVACEGVSIKDRMRALVFASPASYRTKISLDRWVLGH